MNKLMYIKITLKKNIEIIKQMIKNDKYDKIICEKCLNVCQTMAKEAYYKLA